MSTVKYAVELNGLDIGSNFRYVKKYRYGGKEKEKVQILYKMQRIEHRKLTGGNNVVTVFAKEAPTSYYTNSTNLEINTQGEVYAD